MPHPVASLPSGRTRSGEGLGWGDGVTEQDGDCEPGLGLMDGVGAAEGERLGELEWE